MALRLTSDAFDSGDRIPARFTCEGANVSPPLRVEGVPGRAECLVLIVDDPDAPNGVFTHWLLYNLPPDVTRLEEGFNPGSAASGPPVQGRNDFGHQRYEGPCPPAGDDAHHYYFRLYALDGRFDLPAGATRAQILDAMQDHVVAQTELIGRYRRAGVPAPAVGQGARGWDYEFYAELPDLTSDDQQRLSVAAESRLADLTRGNRDMVGASVAIEPVAAAQDQQPLLYRARVVVYIRPDNIAATEKDPSAEAALHQVLDVIERQVREDRSRRREPWKQP